MASSCPATNTAVMAGVASTSLRLFSTVLSAEGAAAQQGVFMSPLSIVFALSLALNGAGTPSTTHSELFKLLTAGGASTSTADARSEQEYNSELGKLMAVLTELPAGAGDSGPRVILANSVWSKGMELKKAYTETMKAIYKATARKATGAAEVNAWVEEVTQGKIKSLVPTDNFDAILANAIYFKGLWEHAFKPTSTKPLDFKTLKGGPKQVPMMRQTFEPRDRIMSAHAAGVYRAVALPYKGGTYSAVAVLPDEGVTTAAALEAYATKPAAFEAGEKLVVVLPKFKVESSMSLSQVLQQLGVKAAFSNSADFSRMADGQLYISDVLHKAVVEVDEEGTVAAAATAIMMTRSMPLPPTEIVFDRPFIFIIRHDATNMPVFVGVVNDPSAGTAPA